MPKNHNGPVNAHRRDEKASPLIAWRKSADLSNEIINLVQFLEPTPEEIHARTALVGQYRKIIHDNYEGSQLFVFGSFATGLYTPWSDMDFVVLPSQPVEHTKGQIASRLSKIARKCYPFTRDLQILRRARVPILKITDQSGYLIDLGYSGDNNQQRSVETVKERVIIIYIVE